jgi:hypothetical protein
MTARILHVLLPLAAAPLGAAGGGSLLAQTLPPPGPPVGALWGGLLAPPCVHLLLRRLMRPPS